MLFLYQSISFSLSFSHAFSLSIYFFLSLSFVSFFKIYFFFFFLSHIKLSQKSVPPSFCLSFKSRSVYRQTSFYCFNLLNLHWSLSLPKALSLSIHQRLCYFILYQCPFLSSLFFLILSVLTSAYANLLYV